MIRNISFAKHLFLGCFFLVGWGEIKGQSGQEQQRDSLFLRSIYDQVLEHGHAYENLRVLCKEVGARLSGSPEAEKAVMWGEQLLLSYPFDSVYLQAVKVPHWVRGEKEKAGVVLKNGKKWNFSTKTLGGSVPTQGKLKGEVIAVQNFEQLAELGSSKIKGKIVFFNRPMDGKLINTGSAYGGCVNQRVRGASEAAKYGAIGVIIRSVTHKPDGHAHTGSVVYSSPGLSIPAAAISLNDADFLAKHIRKNQVKEVFMQLDCSTLPDAWSYNVIAEIKGNRTPNQIITVGGHLDSWDVGEGAHDDGAGVVHSIEALRVLMKLNYRPNNTLRVVLFMNEENGNNGGKTYAYEASRKGEKHVAALESDAGGFLPLGFTLDGPPEKVAKMKTWAPLLKPYQLYLFDAGWGGVDIGPLKSQDVPLLGLRPDSQRYFDHHHSDTDVFENVHKRELELGCGALASMIYLIDRYGL